MLKLRKINLEEWAAGVVMVAVMVAGQWQAVQALWNSSLLDIPHTWSDFRAGITTERFSKHLDSHLPIRDGLIAFANAGRYVLTNGAGDQVRLGKDEWLFSVEEIQYHPDASTSQAERVAIAGKVSAGLRRLGVELLVVVVPDKARVQSAQLADGVYPAWYSQRHASLVRGLQEQGVRVLDVLPEMQRAVKFNPLYYRTDTHWNQAGAQLVAELVAQQIRLQGLNAPATGFSTTRSAASTERVGDLLSLLGLARVPDALRPNPDQEHTDQTAKSAVASSAGLLGDVNMPVVLVGTSFSQRANFHGYLQAALQAEVLNVATDGGGFIQSMAAYLLDDAFRTSPPQWLVWEIPERAFSKPLIAAETTALPL